MDPASFHFLLTPEGRHWLAEASATPMTPDNHLQLAMQLRRSLPPAEAHAVLETVLLRQRARAKFERADQMYFTREALEQASAEIVSRYRARRFARMGPALVADLGCGIGGDALALAGSCRVLGVELDTVRLAMARQNVAVYGRADAFEPLQANLLELPPLAVDAFFADPGRRDEDGRRLFSVHQYRPPLAVIERWCRLVPAGAVKVSPAVAYAELPAAVEIEFISVGGEVREGVIWYGDLRTPATRRATLLPEGVTLTEHGPIQSAVAGPGRYLYEPDGAVIRAGLVEQLAAQLDAYKIDAEIAYLTADQFHRTPFARGFAIDDFFPFQLKRLRRYLRERHVGQVIIKKRGSPLEPDSLRRQLRLSGSDERVIFLTRVKGEAAVIIGQELEGNRYS
jgi:SAM-dependent methyltransferase